MKNAPAWLSAATADKAMAFAVVLGVLLVIILLARAVGHLSRRPAAAAPPPAPRKSGGSGGKLLLAAAGAVGGWVLYERHQNAAAPAKAAPAASPSPAPRPTVTQTVAPHVTAPVHLPLSGTQILIMLGIAAVVAIVLVGPLLRRSS